MNLGLPLSVPVAATPGGDPLEAYLREKSQPQEPDLESYLREKRVSDMAAKTGGAESLGRGALQGASLGFSDEIRGAGHAIGGKLANTLGLEQHPESFGDLYHAGRNQEREANEAAKRAHGRLYTAGEIGGGLIPGAAATIATGGAAALPMAVAQGAAQGAGYSNADSAGGLAGDTALGAGVGLLGYGTGQAVGAASSGVRNVAAGRAGAAATRAAIQAADEEAAKVASLAGKYGGEVQKGSRITENLGRLSPSMNPAQQGQLAAQGPAVQQLEQQVAGSSLKALPTQAATIASREAELRAAQSALPQAVAARTAELNKPTFLKDALSFGKSYAEPMIAAYAADKAGEALGLDPKTRAGLDIAAGAIFSRTRAGKALATRLNRPGNQQALWGAVEGATPKIGGLLRRAIAASTSPATEYLVGE